MPPGIPPDPTNTFSFSSFATCACWARYKGFSNGCCTGGGGWLISWTDGPSSPFAPTSPCPSSSPCLAKPMSVTAVAFIDIDDDDDDRDEGNIDDAVSFVVVVVAASIISSPSFTDSLNPWPTMLPSPCSSPSPMPSPYTDVVFGFR